MSDSGILTTGKPDDRPASGRRRRRVRAESDPPQEPSRPRERLSLTAKFLAGLARFLSGSSVRWLDSQPDTAQRIYFANHTSHLDPLVLWAALPPEVRLITRPVAARDYWIKSRLRRYIAEEVFNALLIDRENIRVHNSPIKIMLDAIGTHSSLIVFPEGHRNTADELDEFKSGLFHLCRKRPDLELIPVYIDNVNRVLPRGEFLPVPLLSCITFGPPMWLEDKEPKQAFLKRARDAVIRLREITRDG